MARNDALASGHIIINSIIQFSVKLYVTEKLTVDHGFLSYTQLQTALALKPFVPKFVLELSWSLFLSVL